MEATRSTKIEKKVAPAAKASQLVNAEQWMQRRKMVAESPNPSAVAEPSRKDGDLQVNGLPEKEKDAPGAPVENKEQPVEREEWLQLGTERGWFLTMDDLAALKMGEVLDIASSLDQGPHDDLELEKTYPSSVFWASCRESYSVKDGPGGKRIGMLGGVEYPAQSKGDKTPPFYDDDEGGAALGTESSPSMLWSNVLRMPPIFMNDE